MDSCIEISKYTTNSFLRSTIISQIFFSLISIIGIFATFRRIFFSILIDSAFKEHLCLCYFIHFIQNFFTCTLQTILLFQYLTKPPCFAVISSYLCYILRFASIFSMFALPLLNLGLAVYRSFSFIGCFGREKETMIRRFISMITILGSCGECYWKVSGVEIPAGEIPYCIGNLKGLAEKSNTESLLTGIFEVITISSAFVLLALYKRENRLQKSYDVSVNLTRRQLISTMRIFLPYSLFHGFCFLTYSLISIVYREIFLTLEEPWYSAGSGYIFTPRYFTVISPWILYWIVVKTEKRRISKTKNLLKLESQAKNVYFANYHLQWNEEKKSASWLRKLRIFRYVVNVNKVHFS